MPEAEKNLFQVAWNEVSPGAHEETMRSALQVFRERIRLGVLMSIPWFLQVS